MREEIKQSLDSLKQLDLSSYPYNDIQRDIQKAGIIGQLQVTLHSGKPIFRARLNEENEHYYSKCQLTYKPQQFNKTCQRASTPSMTMFYGSILPEEFEEGELDMPRVVPTYEAVPWLRDKNTSGVKRITYTKWFVKEEINIIAILQHDKFYDRSSYTRKLMDDFNAFLDQYPDRKEETIAFTSFLADEFAKEVTHDYDYLISAAYTNNLSALGIDGVLYPSVQLNGTGFNVALTPQVADTKLDLAMVAECVVYKLKDQTVMDNELQAVLYPNQTHFELQNVREADHAGKEICLEQLGVKSINDLQ